MKTIPCFHLRRPQLAGGVGGLLLLAGGLLGACNRDHFPLPYAAQTVIYTESNIAGSNQNSILAYRQKKNGSLEALPGSPFPTGGSGVANPTQRLGTDDNDQPLWLSDDGKRLFATNMGSNTIAVFDVQPDGALQAVPGSPFPSGGVNPESVGIANDRLYVVNKNDDPAQPNDARPNYTVFTIHSDGRLTPIPGSTIETVPKASPTQAYVAPNQKVLFGADFLAFAAPTPAGTLRGFAIAPDGKLTPAPGTPMPIADEGGALGLWSHPTQNVLYVGFPVTGKVGVYSYDGTTGALTFRTSVKAGKAACWLRVNRAGTRLYAVNTAESTISVYELANPLNPKELQVFAIKKPGPLYDSMSPAGLVTSSEPFHEEFSPDESYLYVVSQHANPDFSVNYNYLHALFIGPDGLLSEPTEPIQPPVPATARPQGVVSLVL